MPLEEGKLQQLKIYFLFMHADGESSSAETKYLDDIITKIGLSETAMREFQAYRKQMAIKLSKANSKMVIAEIDGLLGEKSSSRYNFSSFFSGFIDRSKTMQAQTIWTLINLGYADKEYSDAEKQVVSHLVKRWEIDPILVAEFNDTAETILALTVQKQWIQTTSRLYAIVDSTIQEIDRNIASMFANVEISISESDIA